MMDEETLITEELSDDELQDIINRAEAEEDDDE